MKVLITGASSGIGRDMARYLAEGKNELILVARRRDRLEALKKELNTPVEIYECDVSNADNCIDLYKKYKDSGIDMLINNAGFGYFGSFCETDLEKELEMIDTNVRAVHILTKLFLREFVAHDKGRILNVSSSAGFLAGPLLSTYYASKNYVLRLSEAIYEELRRKNSRVQISVLCPGPVRTEFDKVANVRFSLSGLSSEYVAKYAIDKAMKNKLIIMPGLTMRLARFGQRFVPEKLLLKFAYNIQHRKENQ